MLLAGAALGQGDPPPDWTQSFAVGAGLSSGLDGFAVEAGGVTYVTGISGPSGSTDILTAAVDGDGNTLWTDLFDSGSSLGDQARGLTLGLDGRLYVVGNTPGPSGFADVLVLVYDPASGARLDTIQHTEVPSKSEHGAAVVVNAAGEIFVTGGTVGDGADVLVMKFDANGQVAWRQTWDGPAASPFSGDTGRQIHFDPNGDLIVLASGNWSSLQPDFIVLKLSAADGSFGWVANWGGNGGESGRDLVVDAAGDVYVTGVAINFTDMYSTIKLSGADGGLIWQAYDAAGIDDGAFGIALDGAGGVYVTGSVDHDGDQSNFNDNLYVVKRDAATGAQQWTYEYGATCVGCSDGGGAILTDSAGHVFVGGGSSSPPFSSDLIVWVLDASTGALVELRSFALSSPESLAASALGLDAQENLHFAGTLSNANTGAKQIFLGAYPSIADGPTTYCAAKASSSGCLASVSTSDPAAQPVSGAGGYAITASGVESFKNGLLFGGISGAAALPFNGGTLCVNPPTKRGAPLGSGGVGLGTCTGSFATEINGGVLFPSGLDAGPGNAAWYQYWYRDPQNGAGSLGTALSNAASVVFL